jgi:general secretion pathway protein K
MRDHAAHPHASARPRTPKRAAQKGAAVLMALFIATLATLIVTGLFWNQFIVLRTIENQQLTQQSQLLLSGALDWARAILREDLQRTSYDALTEPWAQPLAQTRLDQLGETSTLAARATIEGNIEDEQARMNLRNLIGTDGKEVKTELDALRRLCGLLALPSATADLIGVAMQEAHVTPGSSAGGVSADGTITLRPLPLVLPQDLYGVRGLDAQAAAKLVPYVAILDGGPTKVNVNTAPAEVIAARVGITLLEARALVAERDRLGRFRDVGDFILRLPGQGQRADLDKTQIDTASSYFLIRGKVKLDRVTSSMEALVKRFPDKSVKVLWQREL